METDLIEELDLMDAILNDPVLLEVDEYDDSISDVIEDMLKDKFGNLKFDD